MRLMVKSLVLTLVLAVSAHAQSKPANPFPDDYKPHPCAAADACANSWEVSSLRSAGTSLIGAGILDPQWIEAHHQELLGDLKKTACPKIASCYAVPGTSYMFCDDLVMQEARTICDRYTDKTDLEQCKWFIEVVMLGIDAKGMQAWQKAQDCSKNLAKPFKSDAAPIVWSVPATISSGYNGPIIFYALDAETHLPLLAPITIEGQTVYSPANPAGSTATGYPFKWPRTLNRVAGANGHEEAVVPNVTIAAPGYPAVTLTMPYVPSKMILSLSPDASKFRAGVNKVKFQATDSVTGKPIDARLMVGDLMLVDSNPKAPVEFELPSDRKNQEIWVKPLNRNYSDVVLVPAKKK